MIRIRRAILIIFLFLGCFLAIGILIQRNKDAVSSKQKIKHLMFEKERYQALSNMYFKSLEIIGKHQNSKVSNELVIKQNEVDSTRVKLSDIILSNKIVLFIPKYSCKDCIKDVIDELKLYAKFSLYDIVILTSFYDINDQKAFLESYNLSRENKWKVFHLESEFYFEELSNKIFLAKLNPELTILNCFVYDTDESLELLNEFLNNI